LVFMGHPLCLAGGGIRASGPDAPDPRVARLTHLHGLT
jgi:hypothetical protein